VKSVQSDDFRFFEFDKGATLRARLDVKAGLPHAPGSVLWGHDDSESYGRSFCDKSSSDESYTNERENPPQDDHSLIFDSVEVVPIDNGAVVIANSCNHKLQAHLGLNPQTQRQVPPSEAGSKKTSLEENMVASGCISHADAASVSVSSIEVAHQTVARPAIMKFRGPKLPAAFNAKSRCQAHQLQDDIASVESFFKSQGGEHRENPCHINSRESIPVAVDASRKRSTHSYKAASAARADNVVRSTSYPSSASSTGTDPTFPRSATVTDAAVDWVYRRAIAVGLFTDDSSEEDSKIHHSLSVSTLGDSQFRATDISESMTDGSELNDASFSRSMSQP